MVPRAIVVTVVSAVLTCGSGLCAAAEAPGENLARGKPYRLAPAPTYRHCTDGGDRTQLTDGVYTKGYFWTQKTTVGWQNVNRAQVTIDLGAIDEGDVGQVDAGGVLEGADGSVRSGPARPGQVVRLAAGDAGRQ